jgi:CubicO group peptidase (beta-lactamase class C family)
MTALHRSIGARLAGLVILLALLAAPPRAAENDLPIAKPESVGVSSARLERIKGFIKDYIDTNRIAGAVTLVARKGKVVHHEAHGWRFKEESQPMVKDAIFTLQSMTKPIVSTALMMLWEDGKFMLDDPISKWLPAYANQQVLVEGRFVKPARPVTVRHVLTHTSGLSLTPNDAITRESLFASLEERAAAAAAAQKRVASTPAQPRPATLSEAIDRAAALPLAFHPGDRWQYGASTDFVGILVEKISGMSLDEFLRQQIFEPLGMRDTYYNVPREKVNQVTAVYSPDRQGAITLFRKPEFREPTKYFPGVAGLNGTAGDYFKFAQMLLNGGELNGKRLLGRMTVDAMFHNQIGTDKPVYVRGDGYGFGLGGAVLMDRAKAADALSTGTWSWGGAWGTIFWIDPVEELIPIMLIQVTSYSHLNIRPLFSVVASQAVLDPKTRQ